jgi:lipoprotein-releasing system permease protein
VRGVWRETDSLGVILAAGGKTGAAIRAVDPSFWEDAGSRAFLSVVDGQGSLDDDGGILLGEDLAREVGAAPGKPLRLMTLRVTEDGLLLPHTALFTVKGIVSSGYHELDAMWCIISFEAGKRVTSGEISQTFLVAKIDEPYRAADGTGARLARALDGTAAVYTWRELQSAQYSSYESTRQLLVFIMALIVLVAAVNVSSATAMLVLERQRDIAVLKAAGASGTQINRVFVLCSLLTGAAGAVPGIAAGLLIGCSVNRIIRTLEYLLSLASALLHGEAVKILDPGFYLQNIPVIIDWKAVALIGVFAVLCSCASSLFCARKAGLVRPLDLLRKF